MNSQEAAEKAASVIGFGYDLASDIRLSSCKSGPTESGLIEIDRSRTQDLVVPGNVVVSNASTSIRCVKGESTRFSSDALSFDQMSEHFNQELSLSGKIPSGIFNAMFGFNGCWQRDAATAKVLAFDGWFITLYTIELGRSQITLSDKVKQQVPSTWDPIAFAKFIENYGTHVIVGVKMGGKDVIHMKQLRNSNRQPFEVQKLLKDLADEKFSEDGELITNPVSRSKSDHPSSVHIRRGGSDKGQSHKEWLSTVSQYPNVISMSFVPIASLLRGTRGSGFLIHAINLYLRYKPQIEELAQFFEHQLPRLWAAPAYNDRKTPPQSRLLGPKLFVNTAKVDSGNRPITGIRLHLDGERSDHLAIHLQHLSYIPRSYQLSPDHTYKPSDEWLHHGYFEPVKWSVFSHVCTAPIQHHGSTVDESSASIVTRAWFEVKGVGTMKKVLFLRLWFANVASAKVWRTEWDGPSYDTSKKSGMLMSMLTSKTYSSSDLNHELQEPAKVDLNSSAVYPDGSTRPKRAPKMSQFVDTREMVRGPGDPPGYWVVTGAKLCLEGGVIGFRVKYSLVRWSDDSWSPSSVRSVDSCLLQ